MSRWIVEPADKPDPHPERLSHEDVQRLAQTYEIFYLADLKEWRKWKRGRDVELTQIEAEFLVPHMGDPVIRKLTAVMAAQKLRAC